MSQLIPSKKSFQTFKEHILNINGVVVFPDRRRMATASWDRTLRLWDLNTGAVLKKMEGHHERVLGLAVSPDGQTLASSDASGELIAWHGETGEPLTKRIEAHSSWFLGLDFSPDGTVLATGATDHTMKLWNTKTWKQQGSAIKCDNGIHCVRYSPSGKLLAVATYSNIEIYNSVTRERVASFKGQGRNYTVAWTPDGTRIFTGGDGDPSIREWDTSTWQQVDDPWTGHTGFINAIAFNSDGTLFASASDDGHVRLWRLSDRRNIAIFQHSATIQCVTFSLDGRYILSGGGDNIISVWDGSSKILAINKAARNACIAGDLSTAEQLFTQEIDTDANNYTSYANRSFVMARKHDWDNALDDATTSVNIQPSLTGYISRSIALRGKGQVQDARTELDLAFMFTDEDSNIVHFLLLIKAIIIFNADQNEEAILRVRKLAAACPNSDTFACSVVEAYLRVQLGINALNGGRHDEAVDHFTAAVKSSVFPSKSDIHSTYEDLVVLFGWDLKSLWQNGHRKQCDALRQAGRHEEAVKSYRFMMDMCDENTKASCLDWSNAFTQEYSAPYITSGDAALAASDYERAIKSYSLAIDLNSASDAVFANRSKARSETMLWEDALLDAHKVIELNPLSYVGYQVKHAALYGAQRYDDAIAAFQMMLDRLESAHDMHIQQLRERYISPSEAEGVIQKVIDTELNTAPIRLLDTATGILCDREAQISAFKRSTEYNELLLPLITKHPDIRMERITEVVTTYFRCVMLSHRWEGKEPLLQDIQGKIVYQMKSLGGLVKLRTFCEIARDAGYRWAWTDTCCIDKSNNVELQESLNSMFVWYRHSALTIVYLSDVLPSSNSGALAKSEWIRRGWTFQEFVAPKVVLFYRKDWSLYLDDRSPNHKESAAIMEELEGATGIDRQALVAFRPGMSGIRERLQSASARITTLQEDVAYSLFGIFGVQLPVIYGEKKQNALGRLLQEIVARSGDVTALDWVGQSSGFNSCLPADITSYAAPPCALPSVSEDDIQTAVSSLRNTVAIELASKLYDQLDDMSAPRFANCRLHLPCIAFRVTEVRRNSGSAQEMHFTYGLKADGLHDLLITTKETLNQFTPAKPPLQAFLLVRPWDRHLLELPDFEELPDFGDDTQSEDEYWSVPGSPVDELPSGSPVEQEMINSESHSRALRLIVRLGQPFGAFLLARQRGGEYKRIASDHDIIAQVKDVASVHNIMDGVKIIEIL
ncbi:hypothetical protein DFH29DRAFT_55548 [Suillus ampliporus]|nr:hypothetical protein DFH29DRAFT_55548 [Suillus ampliporus]